MLPVKIKLTDIYGETWESDQGGPLRLVYSDSPNPTGLMGAPFEYDEYTGPTMSGVVVSSRNDQVNTIGCDFYVYGDRDTLTEFIAGHGRGFARVPDGPLMKFEVEDTGRFQMVRATLRSEPELAKIAFCGRARQQVEYRSDETWWRTDPVVEEFVAAEFASATVTNAGDEPSFPHYRIEGPLSGGKIGLMGELLTLPNLTAGQWLEINTDPDEWEVRDQAGLDRSDDINGGDGNRWHTQAPVTEDPIPVSIVGTGTTSASKITVTVPQLFWSAL